MRETLRVLKPGGALVVIVERHNKSGSAKTQSAVLRRLFAYHEYDMDAQQSLFLRAGYRDVRTIEGPTNGWMCATGRKYSSASEDSR